MQLELFQADPCEELFPYWKRQLTKWPRAVFEWRHYRDTTGWSMACGGYSFARFLFSSGQITRHQFRRFWRFNRRVRRWDRR